MPDPLARRLTLPRGYATPGGQHPLLPWSHVVDLLRREQNFWLATVRPDNRPHVTPLWGVWVNEALYFDGIPTARWGRNLAANPECAIHLESGERVVILEGSVEDLVTDEETGRRIVDAWDAKYGRLHPRPATDGILRLRPLRARAWTAFPEDVTGWEFPDPSA